jgi:hypothetical protein
MVSVIRRRSIIAVAASAVFVLTIVGVILAAGVRRIQAHLRWQPASTMAT